jgi:hypothetical protein
MRKRKEPTSTSIVEATLKGLDDFATGRQLQELTRLDTCHVSASLYHLKKYRAAECMEAGGTLWWFSTPDTDTRTKTVDERTPESKPRKARRAAKKAA